MPTPSNVFSDGSPGASSARSALLPSTIPTNETNKDRLGVKLETMATDFAEASRIVGRNDHSKQIAACYGHLAAFTKRGSELLTEGASLIPQIQNSHFYLKRARKAAKHTRKNEWDTLDVRTAEAEVSVFEAIVYTQCPDPNSEINLGSKKIERAYFHPNRKYRADSHTFQSTINVSQSS